MKKHADQLIYSPSDLIRFLASPFASWMDRYYLEHPGMVAPDEETEDAKLIAQTGNEHEQTVLAEFKSANAHLVEIPKFNFATACTTTISAIAAKAPIIYQAALEASQFAGYADFLLLDPAGQYQVWDTKLARSPKPYYAVQLCCYSEMLAAVTGGPMPDKFGIILGGKDRVEFRVEDFIHYYRHIKAGFLVMQANFTGKLSDRPEPLPRADHGRWSSHAEKFFNDTDHLVRVAGITVGQIKRLNAAGIATVTDLAKASGKTIHKLGADSLEKLVAQARLQCETVSDRRHNPEAIPRYEVLPHLGANGEAIGLAALPPDHPADVFFDMEGYSMLAKELTGVCHSVGLDPFLGFMHQPRYGRPALALDLMEEFRPLVADSVAISLINRGELGPEDFIRRANGTFLNDRGRRPFWEAWFRRLDAEVSHPEFSYKMAYRRMLEVQARQLWRFVRGEALTYHGFTTR